MHRPTRRMLLAAAAAWASWASRPPSAEELRILAWQGYADDDWVAEFEKETGAEVSVVFAQTDDEIWSKIKGSEGEDFDLFAVNTSELQRYIDAGLAVPHDLAKIPNQQQTLPQFRDLAQVRGVERDGKVYGIPFAFDSIGLIYDTTKVNPPPDSMNVLWDPKYKGKILLYDASAHNFSFAALAEGIENPFHLTDAQLQEIKGKLIELQNNALSYYQSADEALQIYNSNDVALIFANFGQQQLKLMKDAGRADRLCRAEGRRACLARHLGAEQGGEEPRAGREMGQLRAAEEDLRRADPAQRLRQHGDPAGQRQCRTTSSSGCCRSRTSKNAATSGTRSRRQPNRRRQPVTGRQAAARGLWLAAAWLPAVVLIVLPLAGFLTYSLFRVENGEIVHQPSLANYARFFGEGVFLPVFLRTCLLAAEVAAITVLVGYPVAIWLASLEGRRKLAMTLAFAVPLLMSYIIKIYAIRAILGGQGWLNRLLLWTGDRRPRSTPCCSTLRQC